MKISCGDLARDRITGFVGIVVCIAHYQYNQDRVGLKPRDLVNGVPGETLWFDTGLVEVVKSNAVPATPLDKSDPLEYGTKAKDKISGFSGVVTGIDEWINGCVRYRIETDTLHDGSPVAPEAFARQQLEVLSVPVLKDEPVQTGGPMKNPTINANPTWQGG